MIQILEDMLQACILEFRGNWKKYLHLCEFAYNNSYQSSISMALFEALYGRPCRSPVYWLENEDHLSIGLDEIVETSDKIAIILDHLKVAQSRQKSYADNRHRMLEFNVGELVLLSVSPRKGIKRFGVNGKLTSWYIGPFPITEWVGVVPYRLALPSKLSYVHNVFHVSMLCKCPTYANTIIWRIDVPIQEDVSYEETLVKILDRKIRSLRNKEIHIIKVLWQHHGIDEVTCKLKSKMLELYLYLFSV